MRIFYLCINDQTNRDQCRYHQNGETESICGKQFVRALDRSDHKQDHRPQKSAKLIEKLLISKAFACTDFTCRKTDQRILCRFFYRLSDPLHDDQTTGDHPAIFRDQRQCGNSQYLQSVSKDHQGPVLLCFICNKARQQAQ